MHTVRRAVCEKCSHTASGDVRASLSGWLLVTVLICAFRRAHVLPPANGVAKKQRDSRCIATRRDATRRGAVRGEEASDVAGSCGTAALSSWQSNQVGTKTNELAFRLRKALWREGVGRWGTPALCRARWRTSRAAQRTIRFLPGHGHSRYVGRLPQRQWQQCLTNETLESDRSRPTRRPCQICPRLGSV